MWNLLQRWFSQFTLAQHEPANERLLTLERELQSLRLELEEGDRLIAKLKGDLERHRGADNTRVADAVRTRVEQLLTDLAGPVAQLLTQAHLLEVEDKPIYAKDVLGVAKRLVRTLEENGLVLEGSVNQAIPLDPNRHEPLSADGPLIPGEKVVVKFMGASYQGKVIKRAGVAKP